MGQSLIQYMTFLGGLGYIGVLGDVMAKSEEQKRVRNNNINVLCRKITPIASQWDAKHTENGKFTKFYYDFPKIPKKFVVL